MNGSFLEYFENSCQNIDPADVILYTNFMLDIGNDFETNRANRKKNRLKINDPDEKFKRKSIKKFQFKENVNLRLNKHFNRDFCS